GWHIDGFGIFNDHHVEDMSSSMTVFYGPNEAGKSTLMAFLRGVLFGFPDLRSKDPKYPPLNGGEHGGRVFIEEGGERYTVERYAGRGAAARLLDGDGNEVVEGGLERLLGGADGTLFRNIFAFSLRELRRLDTLTTEGVSEAIFSSGIAGAGKPARQAVRYLEEVADKLIGAPGSTTSINLLLTQLQNIDETLANARAAAGDYATKLDTETAAETLVEDAKAAADGARERLRAARMLAELWPAWCDRRAAVESLERLKATGKTGKADGTPDAEFIRLVEAVEALASDIDLQRSRLSELGAKSELQRSAQARIETAIGNLGPGWNQEKIVKFDISIPRREEVRGWGDKLAAARNKVETCEHRVADTARQSEGQSERFEVAQKKLGVDDAGAEARVAELEEKYQQAHADVEKLEAELYYIGTGQTNSDTADDENAPSIEERLEAARQAEQEGQRKFAAAKDRESAIFAELAAARKEGSPMLGRGELIKQEESLERLRAVLTEYAEQSRKVEGLRAVAAALEFAVVPQTSWLSVGLPALLIIVGALAAAGWRLFSGDVTGAIALALGGLVLAATPLVLSRRESTQRAEMQARATRIMAQRQRREEVSAQLNKAESELDAFGQRIVPRAETHGLPAMPDQNDVVEAMLRIRQQLERCQEMELRGARMEDEAEIQAKAQTELKSAEQALEKAQSEATAIEGEWQAWARAQGVSEGLRPAGALDFFVEIAAVRQAMADLSAANQEHATFTNEITAWEKRALEVLSAAGRKGQRGGEDLILEFNALREEVDTEHKLYDRIAAADRAIAASAGGPDRTEAVYKQLATGRLDDWQNQVRRHQDKLETCEEDYRKAVTAHHDVVGTRESLESADDQAEFEFQSSTLRYEIKSAVAEWQRLRLARALIEEALGEFENSRQPGVLAQASAILEKVTDGRYQRVMPDQFGESIAVLNSSGARQATDELSQGTQEQLYMAIRLGLVGEFARRRTRLPLLMDDVLVNFDDDRAVTMARALHEFADNHQILFFTCHKHVAEALRNIDPRINMHKLEVAEPVMAPADDGSHEQPNPLVSKTSTQKIA
ncbi:MAG: AAA family ATPase, partial [Alphaproteobacteria bacterium]